MQHILYYKHEIPICIGRSEKMFGFMKYTAWALVAVALGIMLALLLPIYFVAGLEALIIVILAISCGCRRRR